MTEQGVPGSNRAVEDGLDIQLERFLATLAAAGYVETTRHEKRRLIVPFIRWAGKAGRQGGGSQGDVNRLFNFTFQEGAGHEES